MNRLLYYGELPSEGDDISADLFPLSTIAPDWPDEGRITFKDVFLRYRPGLEPSLRGVSFAIKAGERVAIVGRTGASKSTLMQALFRCVEIENGRIRVDAKDIRQLGVETLRSRLSCVPQEPFLWSGTIRLVHRTGAQRRADLAIVTTSTPTRSASMPTSTICSSLCAVWSLVPSPCTTC